MKGKSVLTKKIESEIDLLQRHVIILNTLIEHEPIGIIRLSEQLGIPQHKVRYSMRILEAEGLINPSSEGAVTTERLDTFFEELVDVLMQLDSTVNRLRVGLESKKQDRTNP
jgi:predicted transcriptional regulator